MKRPSRLVVVIFVMAVIAGCASHGPVHRGGAYYQNDGPGDNPPSNLDALPDAAPRADPYLSGPNRPYTVFGHEYVPDTSDRPFVERGIASWYGRQFNGQKTSSGETYNMYAMSAAHPTLPIPSYARVTNLSNGRSVIVRINDRGPFHSGRVIDLSYAAAYKLGYANQGSTSVEVEHLLPRDILAGRYAGATTLATATGSPAGAAQPMTPASPSTAAAPAPVREATAVVASSAATAATTAAATAATTATPTGSAALDAAGLTADSGAALMEPAVVPAPAAGRRTMPIDPDVPADLMPEADSSAATLPVLASAPSGLYLQLGAFRAKTGADDFARHMSRELDGSMAQRLHVVFGDNLFRVQIGPYGERSEAEGAAQRLRDDFGYAVLIVTAR